MNPVTYGLDVVCALEQEITNTLPKSWQEDMMFLKENNRRMHIGANSRKSTKAIHLHYGSHGGTNDDDPVKDKDEWRQGQGIGVKMPQKKQSIGGLLRKLGDSNFESVSKKIRDEIATRENTLEALQEMVDEMIPLVALQCGTHKTLVRFVRYMRAANPSFGHPVCQIPDKPSLRTPVFGMWLNMCVTSKIISKESYETYWSNLMETYESSSKQDKAQWANVFEQVLKDRIHDTWWRPKLNTIMNDPNTPISLCFKIEDYLED